MIKALLVDDEKAAIENLSLILQARFADCIEVIGTARSVAEAKKALNQQSPDVVFLDIEMPDGDGFDVIAGAEPLDFRVIFVTSYQQYAIKAVRAQAFDYLLKPIDLDDLEKAVEKLQSEIASDQTHQTENSPKILTVSMKEETLYLQIDQILHIEADGNYSTFYLSDGKSLVSSRNLKQFEEELDERFFRVHHSHLINLHRISRLKQSSGSHIELEDGSKVPLAKRRRDAFLRKVKELGGAD